MHYDLQNKLTEENKLTEGSFANVYKLKIEDVYAAAKVFKLKQTPQKIETVATKFSALNHENIVKVLRFCTNPSALIFEYCSLIVEENEVCNLNELLDILNENKSFDLKQRINFVHQCSKGLYYLHSQEIIHKDLKPSNILVTGNLKNIQLKIADFDEMVTIKTNILSKFTDNHPKGMTMCYIAPEIINRRFNEVSFKTDVYAWSLTAYEIFSDKSPAWAGIINPMKDGLLVEAIKKGERPDINYIVNLYKNTTNEHLIFKLISQGWDENPDNRPTSKQICDEIARIVKPQGLMSDCGIRNKDNLDLEISLSKISIDETDEARESLAEAKKSIEEKKETVTITVANSDQQYFVDMMLQSPLKVMLIGQLYDILNSGNELTMVISICNTLKLSDKDRTKINLSLGGGGNSARAWLEHLKANNGGIPIKVFEEALTSNNVAFPSHLRDISLVSKLSHSDIEDISELLLPHEAWKNVAGNLGYTGIEIDKFNRVQMRPSSFNPARTLFQLIDQRFPKLTVKEFMAILHENGHLNAFEYMTEQVKKWADTKVSEKIS